MPYKYMPLADGEIRLFKLLQLNSGRTLRCVLHHVTFNKENCQRYSAVSYCWGTGKKLAKLYTGQHGCANLDITEDLALALHHIQQSEHGNQWLWVDQICINQEDKREKGRQVQKMGEIYSQTAQLIIWLGDEDQFTKLAITTINESCQEFKRQGRLETLLQADLEYLRMTDDAGILQINVWFSVARLLTRSWFTRLWIVQEICLPETTNIQVLCGPHQVELRQLSFIQIAMGRYNWMKHGKALLEKGGPQAQYNWQELLANVGTESPLELLRRTGHAGLTNSLLENLLAHHNRICGDERDRIFALVGLSKRSDWITVDYSPSFEDTFRTNTRAIIEKSQSLDILGTCLPRARRNPNLPSLFTPILSRTRNVAYAALPDTKALVENSTNGNENILVVKGYTCQRIRGVSRDRGGNEHLSASNKDPVLGNILNEFWALASGIAVVSNVLAAWLTFDTTSAEELNMTSLIDAFRRTVSANRNRFGQRDSNLGPSQGFDYFSAVAQSISGRKFFMTEDSDMGLGPYDNKKGDIICLFPGAAVPFVLRKRPKEVEESFAEDYRYVLVGECCSHGLMENVDTRSYILQRFEIW